MASSPYYGYIQRYFPPDQWGNADCITTHECSPDRAGYPQSCIADEGYIDCSGNPTNDMRRSYGPFQIFESCWSPYRENNTPFTREQWDKVLDPNVNTWMASIIWSRSGWSQWSTCHVCGICGVGGGAIPHPEGPVDDQPEPFPLPFPELGSMGLILLAGMGLLAGGVAILTGRIKVK